MRVAVIGSFVVDLMARCPHLPSPGETVKGSFFRLGAGGKGYNQAVAAAKAGADLFFSTKVGEDEFARILYSGLKDNGLSDNVVFSCSEAATGAALISVDEQTSQNEIVVVPGSCECITGEEIQEMFKHLDDVRYLLLQLEINTDAMEEIIERAYEAGIKVILNPAPVQKIDDKVFRHLYAIVPNEVEAQILSGKNYSGDSDCSGMADFFLEKGVENVIITLGKRGAYVRSAGNGFFIDNYPDIRVVDSTGAGDAFCGGLLAALGEGSSFEESARFANVVSNLSVTRLGTSVSMPARAEIDSFLAAHR